MKQCEYCFQPLEDNETYCFNCNVSIDLISVSIPDRPYNAIQTFCEDHNLDFESHYGVNKEKPKGYVVASVNDLYKVTKTTNKIWEGREIIIHAFHTNYYERYKLKHDTDMKSLIPFLKAKRVYIKAI